MKKRIIAITAAMAIAMALPAYAAEWKQQGSTWQYQNDDGSLATGWQWINGKSYYFDASGNMFASTTTPDGYQVNENGEWVVNGVVQTQQGGTAAEGSGTTPRKFGSKDDAATKGYWSNKSNLTWTWWDGYDGSHYIDGESVVIGNGVKYSDLHPGITDREYLLKEYINYPGEGMTNLNSWGEPKANFSAEELKVFQDFVNSFDWINADEHTRVKAVYDRVSRIPNDFEYASAGLDKGNFPVLQNGVGVCGDYIKDFSIIAKYVGLECHTYRPSLNHGACLVKVNGQWLTIDPTNSTSFYDNSLTVPVDFDIEYNRKDNEYKQSDAYKQWEVNREWQMKLERGEITQLEYYKKLYPNMTEQEITDKFLSWDGYVEGLGN